MYCILPSKAVDPISDQQPLPSTGRAYVVHGQISKPMARRRGRVYRRFLSAAAGASLATIVLLVIHPTPPPYYASVVSVLADDGQRQQMQSALTLADAGSEPAAKPWPSCSGSSTRTRRHRATTPQSSPSPGSAASSSGSGCRSHSRSGWRRGWSGTTNPTRATCTTRSNNLLFCDTTPSNNLVLCA
jgi:hypothetical protein